LLQGAIDLIWSEFEGVIDAEKGVKTTRYRVVPLKVSHVAEVNGSRIAYSAVATFHLDIDYEVTVTNLTALTEFVDALSAEGVQVKKVYFDVADKKTFSSQALQLALLNAQCKAGRSATAVGVELRQATSIIATTSKAWSPNFVQVKTPLISGFVLFKASAKASFKIRKPIEIVTY
jgi:uncharacterized protein YggE